MTTLTVTGPEHSPGPVDAPRPVMPPDGLAVPDVLLLDEGGVLSLPGDRSGAVDHVAEHISEMIARAGVAGPTTAEIAADIGAGKDFHRQLKMRHLTDPHPVEIDHRTFWHDLVAASWPEPARTLVRLECEPLSNALSNGNDRRQAPGALDLLAWATGHNIRVGLVANTFAAGATRARLAAWGMDRYLAVQVHSAEIGHRKPDPALLITAMTALNTNPARCWYVGDSRAKDVECGRRAAVATTVLVGIDPVSTGIDDPGPDADLHVRNCAQLQDVLRDLAGRPGTGRYPSQGTSEEGTIR